MWIEVKGLVIDKTLSDLGLDNSGVEIEVRLEINTNSIEGYREVLLDDGTVSEDEVLVYLNGSGSFIIRHSYDEFKKLIQHAR
jgi:hypothetical protein